MSSRPTQRPGRDVPCPVCQSPAGRACVSTTSSKPLRKEHIERQNTAGWPCPECLVSRRTVETLRAHRGIAHEVLA